MTLKNGFGKCICFISQSMKRSKHGLFVFPPKKTLIRRRHCSICQSCCSMTSKRFLESSSDMKFFQPSIRLTSQKRRAFVSVRQTNQIALFPFVCCFCFVRAFSFQGHRKFALMMMQEHKVDQNLPRITNRALWRFSASHLLFHETFSLINAHLCVEMHTFLFPYARSSIS